MAKETAEVQVASSVVTGSGSSKKWYRRHKAVVVGIAGILLIGGVVVLILVFKSPKKSPVVSSCSTQSGMSLLQQAAPLLANPSQQQQVQSIATKIQQLPNYQQDPNCLYVVTQKYASMGDKVNSKLYLTKLQTVYKPSVGFDTVLTKNGASLQVIAAQVTLAQDQPAVRGIIAPNTVGKTP